MLKICVDVAAKKMHHMFVANVRWLVIVQKNVKKLTGNNIVMTQFAADLFSVYFYKTPVFLIDVIITQNVKHK
jgi:hypothetical protein